MQRQRILILKAGEVSLAEEANISPQANQVVDGDIVFTSPGQSTYARDIRLSDNFGSLRFIGADSLTTTPAGAAIQFFGNNASPFNGQLYLDSGALNTAALIFRTAQTGGTITKRMRVAASGNVGIGTSNPSIAKLQVESGGNAVRGESTGSGQGVSGFSGSGNGVLGVSSTGSGVEASAPAATACMAGAAATAPACVAPAAAAEAWMASATPAQAYMATAPAATVKPVVDCQSSPVIMFSEAKSYCRSDFPQNSHFGSPPKQLSHRSEIAKRMVRLKI